MDLHVVRAMCNKKIHDRLLPNIPKDMLKGDTINMIAWISMYFKTYPNSQEVNWEAFDSMLTLRGKALSKDDKIILKEIGKQVQQVDEQELVGSVNMLTELAYSGELAVLNLRYQNGDEVDLLYETKALQRKYSEMYLTNDDLLSWEDRDIDEILEANEDGNGLMIRCLPLNVRACRGGDNILVAAQVDAGKTSLIANMAVDFANQMKDNPELYGDRPILWIVNESMAERAYPRVYQAATKMSLNEVRESNKAGKFRKLYTDVVGSTDKIRIKDGHSLTMAQIETIIEEMKPAVTFIDMVANVKGGTAKEEYQNIEAKWQQMRTIGCEHDCFFVGTMQLSVDAYDTMYPPLHALKQSKIGAQGAVDLAIMMGNYDPQLRPEFKHLRGISTPKNKMALSGVSGFNQFQVEFDGNLCAFNTGVDETTIQR